MMNESKVNVLKACITSKKGGIFISELNDDYKELVGENIPFKVAGFKTLKQYLESINGVTIRGNVVLCTCKESRHIENMIHKQKSKTFGTKRKYDHFDLEYPPLKKRTCNRFEKYDSPPKAYFYNPQNHAFQKNLFMFNHSYDEYDCIYGEKNSIYKLIYSLCQLLIQNDVNIPSRLMQTGGPAPVWLQPLNNNEPTSYNSKTCFQTIKSDGNMIIYGHQIIGDDYMIHLTSNQFGFTSGGTCLHGLTLKEAHELFLRKQSTKDVIIMCGSLDVHHGMLLDDIVKDMQDLILCVLLSGCIPKVCTIPPSPHWWLNHQISVFNYWLFSLTNLTIIDLHSPFITKFSQINYSYFNRYPTHIRGKKIYLWSKAGQDIVMKTVLSTLTSS